MSDTKARILDMFSFVREQIAFIKETTKFIVNPDDFVTTQNGMVLFNSTCMCLQSIGETIRQIDNLTNHELLQQYADIPWRAVIGMRNIIAHEYASIDHERIFNTINKYLDPLDEQIVEIVAEMLTRD